MSVINERRAALFACLTILCWATVATAFKLSLRYLDVVSLVWWSTVLATLVLWGLVLLGGRQGELAGWQRTDFGRSAMLGAINPVIYYLLLFKAYELLPAQQAQVLNFIWPVMLVVLSVWVMGERVSLIGWLALGVSFFGVVVIATQGDFALLKLTQPLGVALALLSSLFWAAYWLMSRVRHGAQNQRDPLLRLAMNFSFGCLWMVILLVAMGVVGGVHPGWPSMFGWLGAAYVALFEMSLAFFFWLTALNASRHTARLSQLIFVTPFLSLLVIGWVLGESITGSTFGGLMLILAGILLERLFRRAASPSNSVG